MTQAPSQTTAHADPEQLLAELETIEARLEQLQAGLARSHRLVTLGTIAATVAHEFNNLLTPTISYCQISLSDDLTDRDLARKALERAHDGAARAAQIANAILGFARQDDDPADRTARVADVVAESLNCLAREPAKDGIELSVDVGEDLVVAMGPVALQQVLVNLILNARKVLKRKGGRLAITARPTPRGGQVQISVADNGPGIPADLLEHVFEPFVTRPPTGTSSGPGGTGLGLAICRDLVDRAGGRIEVDSTPNQGASFHITLPAAG